MVKDCKINPNKRRLSPKSIETDFYGRFISTCQVLMIKEFISKNEDPEGLVEELIEVWELDIDNQMDKLLAVSGSSDKHSAGYMSYLKSCRNGAKKTIRKVFLDEEISQDKEQRGGVP